MLNYIEVMLLERTEEMAEELRTMGLRALNQASRAGAPAYFMNPDLGEGIIRRLPDGTLHRVRVLPSGQVEVIEKLERRI
jgi:hypothetical protein